jgi:uncharacterized protein (UPF0212 family)
VTVEVIKAGVPYNDRTFEIACRMCKALLRFKGADVYQGVDVASIQCPACGAGIMVGPGNVVGLIDVISRDEKEGLNEAMRKALGQQQQISSDVE